VLTVTQVKERQQGRLCASGQQPSATTSSTAVELGREKMLRHQDANQLDAFTTIAELMALGRRDTNESRTGTYSPLLAVTTV